MPVGLTGVQHHCGYEAGENSSLFSSSFLKKIGNINIHFDISQKIKGDRVGNEINFILKSNDKTKFNYFY